MYGTYSSNKPEWKDTPLRRVELARRDVLQKLARWFVARDSRTVVAVLFDSPIDNSGVRPLVEGSVVSLSLDSVPFANDIMTDFFITFCPNEVVCLYCIII